MGVFYFKLIMVPTHTVATHTVNTHVLPSALSRYIEALDRIVLKAQTTERKFADAQTVRKTAITTRMLELVHQVRPP